MKKIMQHIKEDRYPNIYLLYGEERYLVRTYKNKLKEAICQEESMNFSYYEGNPILDRLIEKIQEMNNPATVKYLSRTINFLLQKSENICSIVDNVWLKMTT